MPLLLLLLLTACAGPDLARSPEPARFEARRGLADAAARGPVPLVILAPPPAPDANRIAALAAEGVKGLNVRFAPEAPAATAPHLALWFDPPPAATAADACSPASQGTPQDPPHRLLAVWCLEGLPVAEVRGPAGTEREIWRATAQLFPDDYLQTSGFNLFGLHVGFGGSVGF